jgi:hypothetical protein
VRGATLAVFIAMNWGFAVTLLAGAAVYLLAMATFSMLPSVNGIGSPTRGPGL